MSKVFRRSRIRNCVSAHKYNRVLQFDAPHSGHEFYIYQIEYKGYHATVEYDSDDNIFVGKVFGITDSLNFHGESVYELNTIFHQSIDNCLALCKKLDQECKGTFNVRIPISLHRQAALASKRQNISLNQYGMQAIGRSINLQDTI